MDFACFGAKDRVVVRGVNIGICFIVPGGSFSRKIFVDFVVCLFISQHAGLLSPTPKKPKTNNYLIKCII